MFNIKGEAVSVERLSLSFEFRGFVDSAVKGDGSVSVDFAEAAGAEEVGEVSGGVSEEVEVSGVTQTPDQRPNQAKRFLLKKQLRKDYFSGRIKNRQASYSRNHLGPIIRDLVGGRIILPPSSELRD